MNPYQQVSSNPVVLIDLCKSTLPCEVAAVLQFMERVGGTYYAVTQLTGDMLAIPVQQPAVDQVDLVLLRTSVYGATVAPVLFALAGFKNIVNWSSVDQLSDAMSDMDLIVGLGV